MSRSQITLHNVPPQPTSFVGRMSDISGIIDRLRDPNCRLLTLLGAGGIGKTRLAIEMIRNLTDSDFAHGVFYIPLAPLSSADAIAPAIANILGITADNKASLEQQLIDFLSQRNVLLVLDNFEHVMGGVTLVDEIVSTAPDVTILATSREILNLNMEYIWHVRGMAYPSTSDPEDINRFDALNLFIERAMQVRRDFSPGDEQMSIIRICQLVDGLPLGIELAAGWLKTLSPSEIVRQIDRGIDILATRARNIPDRHRSIRAVFDHSWELLTADERAVFLRLSVFRGGFTLEAAEHVAGADLMVLSDLIEKSMIRRAQDGRYDIHELLRQYGHKLLTEDDELHAVRKGHVKYYATFVLGYADWLKDVRQQDAHLALKADYANIMEAWQRAIGFADFDAIAKMTEALNIDRFFENQHFNPLILAKSIQALPEPITQSQQQCVNRLLAWQAYYMELRNFYNLLYGYERFPKYKTPIQHYEQCLIRAEDTDDYFSQILFYLAIGIKHDINDTLPQELLHGLELSQQYGDLWYVCLYYRAIFRHYFFRHRIENPEGDAYLQAYVNIAIEANDPRNIMEASALLSVVQFDRGQVRDAIASNQIVIEYWQNINSNYEQAFPYIKQGAFYLSLGDFERARQYVEKGIRLRPEGPYNNHYDSMVLAKSDAIHGHPDKGLQILRQINYTERGGVYQYEVAALCYIELGDVDSARHEIMRVLDAGLVQVGSRPMIDLIPQVSFVMFHDTTYEDAVELLGLIDNHPSGATDWMKHWNKLTQLRTDLKTELGEKVYQQAWERGAQRDLDKTIVELIDYLRNDQYPSKAKSQPLIEPLTNRELEVLELLGEGLSNRKIATHLTVSVGTVKTHVHNISQKLNAKNRTQVVLEAKKLGLL